MKGGGDCGQSQTGLAQQICYRIVVKLDHLETNVSYDCLTVFGMMQYTSGNIQSSSKIETCQVQRN